LPPGTGPGSSRPPDRTPDRHPARAGDPLPRRELDHGELQPRNAGNVRTQLDEVDFRLTGAFGRALRDERIQRPQNGGTAPAALPDQVIPGSRLQFSRTFAGLPPIEAITAAVTVRAEDSLLHQPVSTSRSTTFWVVPWPAVALLSALVVLAVARRRRRRRRAHRSVGLSRSPGPARDDAPEDVLVA